MLFRSKYAVQVNGITGLALTKSDVLQGLDCVKACTAYRFGGRQLPGMPSSVEVLEQLEPEYQVFPGWPAYDASKIRSRNDLPAELREYLAFIEDFVGVPIHILSVGPGREETLVFHDPFAGK